MLSRERLSTAILFVFSVVLATGPLTAQNSGNKTTEAKSSESKAASSSSNKASKSNKGDRDDVESIGDRNVSKGMNFYSLEEEIALGKAMAAQVEQQSRIIQDPVVSEYVNRIGQNLVRNSDA